MTNRTIMLKKRRDNSFKANSGSESTESLRSDNLRASVSSMFLRNVARPEVSRMDKKVLTKRSTRTLLPAVAGRAEILSISGIPEDAAVHFGNFYCREKISGNNGAVGRAGRTRDFELPVGESSRSEFTGQMVHKLERLAGTEHYARQISALLEKTVESPNYVVNQPPDDYFHPYERSDIPAYPLWYKDPDKANYRCSSNESSSCIETIEDNLSTSEMQLGESETSDCTLINTSNIDSQRTFDITDCKYNYETSSITSEMTCNSLENTEDDESDCEEVRINIVVKWVGVNRTVLVQNYNQYIEYLAHTITKHSVNTK